MRTKAALALFLSCCTVGCVVPAQPDNRSSLFGSLGSVAPSGSLPERRRPSADQTMRMSGESMGSLTKVDNNVWRTNLPAGQAYQVLSRILSQHYLIAQSERNRLSITTEWDKFFIDGRLFRNRLSATLFPLSSRSTEIVVKNFVEYYSGVADKSDSLKESNWLPSPDLTDEVARVVDAMSKHLSNIARTQDTRVR